MSVNPPDPCAPYRDAQGDINLLELIAGTLDNVECIIVEAKALPGVGAKAVMHGAQLAASQLRAAQAAHKAYLADDSST